MNTVRQDKPASAFAPRLSLVQDSGAPDAGLKTHKTGSNPVLRLSGDWSVATLHSVERELLTFARTTAFQGKTLTIDTDNASRLDTGAIFALWQAAGIMESRGMHVVIHASDSARQTLIEEIRGKGITPVQNDSHDPIVQTLNTIGFRIVEQLKIMLQVLSFSGQVFLLLGKSIVNPTRIRFTALASQMQSTGILALPIVTLLTFLIGLVTMYMGTQQLARLGGQEFAINLLEISVMREMAPLLTAIVIAGRSGSSFTAQIGSMIANEELAAMRTMGLPPMEFLVLPRVLALIFMMPLLTVLADFAAMFGGWVAANMVIDMDFHAFMVRFREAASLKNFMVGVVKAPFFALAISFIGCLQGYRVKKSAESVGKCTTEAVVESLFLVILIDALFALFFAKINI